MSNSSLREQVLERQVKDLQLMFAQFRSTALRNLTTLVHYCGGAITLGEQDYKGAGNLLLTEEVDQAAQTITFRTRRVGLDGGDELGETARGGLLPPDAGLHNESGDTGGMQ